MKPTGETIAEQVAAGCASGCIAAAGQAEAVEADDRSIDAEEASVQGGDVLPGAEGIELAISAAEGETGAEADRAASAGESELCLAGPLHVAPAGRLLAVRTAGLHAMAFVVALALGWGLAARFAGPGQARLDLADAAAAAISNVRASNERELNDLRRALQTAEAARHAAERKGAALLAEAAALNLAREKAESTAAAAEQTLAAERAAHAATVAATDAAVAAGTEPDAAVQPAPIVAAPIEAARPVARPEADVRRVPVVGTAHGRPLARGAAQSALEEGRKHFSRGDVSSARVSFARAFKLGLPEGALALGTTYDPVSLAKSGLNSPGDPARARAWYRRAHELAQTATH